MIRALLLFLLLSAHSYAQTGPLPGPSKPSALNCNNWLNLPSFLSFMTVGDLDIPGNKVTVEAVFNRTTNYSNGYNWAGDLVSKHVDPTDVNYLLRPNNAEITTTNGHYTTPPICLIELNKTYHVAFVYDGSTLKFYRNGYLMSSVPASGNLVQNNHNTKIGLYDDDAHNTNFIGFINEVRIWNVAKTQAEIRSFMDGSLPNPTTQPGLLAYYTFEDLINKQGNAAWNGTLSGGASINNTNPACNLVIDTCALVTNSIGNIINDYTPVLSLLPCENKLVVEDASAFNAGDTVLMIQMKGANIDSSNTALFGDVIDFEGAGNYEFNYVKSKSGNTLELRNTIVRQYDIPHGKVQLVRVPFYNTAKISSILTCLPWDGYKGGVLVLNVQNSLELNANIDVSGKGFRGATMINPANNATSCHENEYYYPYNLVKAAPKGEGIAELSPARSYGKGALANGGGGGLGHNSGGGGGGNASAGGKGGKEWFTCGSPLDNGGIGGKGLTYSLASNKIFMGGGGGAGHCDNPPAYNPNGGNGGGIAIIIAGSIKTNNNKIISNGQNAPECTRNPAQPYKCHEGMGGGGGGGTILIKTDTYIDHTEILLNGGKGADMNGETQERLGPGGGGSGGVVWLSSPSQPSNLDPAFDGGLNGVNVDFGMDSYGATSGQDGQMLFQLSVPFASTPFKANIDSVRFNENSITCNAYDFTGLGYTNTNPISSWYWTFGDGGNANTQNTSHTYAVTGTFNVKLVVEDINGCTDSITKVVNASFLEIEAGQADTICAPNSIILQGSINGLGTYAWEPAIYLDDPTSLNPTATPPTSTTFYLNAINSEGCEAIDSVRIEVRSPSAFFVNPVASVCLNDTVQLLAGGGDLYSWNPSTTLDNAAVSNPRAFPLINTVYTVDITDTVCGNSGTLDVTVNVLPLPEIQASRSNDIDCSNIQSQLNASGASSYSWLPAATLDDPNSSHPIATPVVTTLYTVSGTNADGCTNTDTITVKVDASNKSLYLLPSAFTPNGDGLNDCFGIKYWGFVEEFEFSIWNRWGERIFYTNDPGKCWDGTLNGVRQASGVFVYMVTAKTACDPKVFRKGTITLIR